MATAPSVAEEWGHNYTGTNGTQPLGDWKLWQVLEASTHHQITMFDEALMNNPLRRNKGRQAAPKG
jgi:hypothetical protein